VQTRLSRLFPASDFRALNANARGSAALNG
jgi:hypothetical protein